MKKTYKRMRPLLGTFVEIGCSENQNNKEFAINFAFQVIEEIQNLLSMQSKNSELTKVNSRYSSLEEVDNRTSTVIRLAKYVTMKTQGVFNCTVGGYLINNGFMTNHSHKNYLELGSSEDIFVSRGRVKILKPIALTLDGIAKGYAVDVAIKSMKAAGRY